MSTVLSIEQMREKIGSVYDGISWKNKVHFMPEDQVIAIYYRFRDQGYFNKKKTNKTKYVQKTLWDYI